MDQAVTDLQHLFRRLYVSVFVVHGQFPETFQETVDTVDSAVIPLRIQFRRSDEELIHSQGITAVISYQIIRRNNVSFGFAHLDPVFAVDHTLVEKLGERLVEIDDPDVMKEFRVETGIQQMKHRMFHTADVHVYREIFVCLFFGDKLFIVFVVHVAQEIPRGTCPLGHRVRLALCCSTADRTGAVYPLIDGRQRRFAGSCRLVALYFRETQRKLVFRYRNISAVRAVDDRDRLAPVTLTGEYPVAQFVIDFFAAEAFFLDHVRSLFFQNGGFHSVPLAGVDHGSGCLCVCLFHIFDLFAVFCDDLNDRQIKFFREGKVTVVMCRYTHDRSGTVIRQNVIGQPDRNLCAIQRVDRISAGKYTGLLFVLHTVYIGLHGSLENVLLHFLFMVVGRQALCQSVLRSQYHEGCAVQCIRTCRIDGDFLVSSLHREIDFRTVGTADPVGLHLLNFFRPVQFVQIFQQTISVFGDPQHPLTEIFLCHRSAAALTFSVHDLLIGKAGLTGRTPVDRELFLISKSVFKHLYKDPLSPFVEVRICSVDFHIPVIDRSDVLNLPFDVGDVLFGGDFRMDSHLDRIVFRRKAESIPSHRMDHIIVLLQFIAAPYVGDHIASPVADMKTVS